jgi:ABC-type phosphate transport system substrate-binding protein
MGIGRKHRGHNSRLMLWLLLGLLASPAIAATAAPGLLAKETDPPSFDLPESLPDAATQLRLQVAPSMATINQVVLAQFQDRFESAEVQLSEGDTASAIAAVQAGEVDLAAIGRPLSDDEVEAGLVEVPVSREKIAIILGPDNPFQGDISVLQFVDIFRGEITDWAEVGGEPGPIRFIDRPADSDTRIALSEYDVFQVDAFETGASAETLDTDDTAAVVRALGSDGISYAISGQVLDQDTVRVQSMDGILPDDERYPYSQPRSYVYQGEPSQAVASFLGFVTGEPGQAAVAEAKEAEAAAVAAADLGSGVLALSPDGETLISGLADGSLLRLDGQGNAQGEPIPAHNGPVTAVAFSPDGESLVSGGADGALRRWSAAGEPLGDVAEAHTGPVAAIAFSRDGQTLVTAGKDGSLRRFDGAGNPIGAPINQPQPVTAMALSADGQTAATGDRNGTVRFWDDQGNTVAEVETDGGAIGAIAASPNGSTFVTAGSDGTLRQWDDQGDPVGEPLSGNETPVTAVALSADRILSGDEDGTLRQWDRDGNPLGDPVTTEQRPIRSLGFTPDGDRIYSSSDNGVPQFREASGESLADDPTTPADAEDPADSAEGGLPDWIQDLPPWVGRLALPLIIMAGFLATLIASLRAGNEPEPDEAPALEAAAAEPPLVTPAPASPALPAVAASADGAEDGAGNDAGDDFSDDFSDDFGDDFGDDLGSLDDTEFDAADFAPVAAPAPTPPPTPVAPTPPPPPPSKLAQSRAALAAGEELAKAGRWDAALSQLDRSIESADLERLKTLAAGGSVVAITALMAQALTRRANALDQMGRTEDAEASRQQAAELQPSEESSQESSETPDLPAQSATARPAAPPPPPFRRPVDADPAVDDVMPHPPLPDPNPTPDPGVSLDPAADPDDVTVVEMPTPLGASAWQDDDETLAGDDLSGDALSGDALSGHTGAIASEFPTATPAPDADLYRDNLSDLPADLQALLMADASTAPPPEETAPTRMPQAQIQPPTPRIAEQDWPEVEESRISLAPCDGLWVYVNWTIPHAAQESAQQQGGEKLALRFYEVKAGMPTLVQESDCYPLAQDAYVQLPECDRTYSVSVGYLTATDRWLPLASAEPILLPCESS